MKKNHIEPFRFLNNKLDIDKIIAISDIYKLICISLIGYISMIIISMYVVGGIDFFDLRNYMITSFMIFHGSLPYITIQYEYAILSLFPMLISIYISTFLNDIRLSFVIFQLLMIVCNIITTIAVYFIVLKVYNRLYAFRAGLLHSIAIIAIYTSLTRYDAFPVCLMMISILLFVYKKEIINIPYSYIVSSLGFFTKIFPIVTYPFFILYDIKNHKAFNKWSIIVFTIFGIIFIIPFLIIGGVSTLKPYLFASGYTISNIYVNTFTYTCYLILTYFLRLNISYNLLSIIMSVVMISIILCSCIVVYRSKQYTHKDVILYTCLTLSALIIFAKFHSPQYFYWITPLLAILVVNDVKKILLFIIFQLITFIEFPILFGSYYTNISYVYSAGSNEWIFTLEFFLLEYIILIILLIMCCNIDIWKKLLSIIES